MPINHDNQRYANYLATLLGIVNEFPQPMNQLSSVQGCEVIAAETQVLLDRKWGQGFEAFYGALDELISFLKSSQNGDRFVRAAVAAIWMDQRISYQEQAGEQRVSFYSKVPLSGDQPVFVDKLNTNDKETGIQLHPKFEVCKIYNQQTGEFEPFANRDVYYGLNGQLANVSYVVYDTHQIIHNVVIPYEYVEGKEDGTLRIAFCPLSDNSCLLNLDERSVEYKGIKMRGFGVQSLNNEQQLQECIHHALLLACRKEADIVFFPEMLGMGAIEEQHAGFNTTILDLALDVTKQAKEDGKNLKLPMLIFLPTWWRDGVNSMTVVYQNGCVLGVQKKYIPYVNAKEHWVEALQEDEEKHILVIHIPGIHRIVSVICAEFQPMRDHMAKVLCGGLGATLILVPSYTKGEQDFINSLPTLKDYGATVIWGNSCAAAKEPRVIGGCSIAGLDEIQRFGAHNECGGSCQGKRACLYLVTLPLRLSRQKPYGPEWKNPIEHCLFDARHKIPDRSG